MQVRMLPAKQPSNHPSEPSVVNGTAIALQVRSSQANHLSNPPSDPSHPSSKEHGERLKLDEVEDAGEQDPGTPVRIIRIKSTTCS